MAFGTGTITAAGGAVDSLFKGFGDLAQGKLSAQGLRIKATGDLAEAKNYDLAEGLAEKNAAFTEESTAIKQAQIERSNYLTLGGQQADIAGSGFKASGSALDIMADSARQGALTQAVGERQGIITETGYNEQAQSFATMSNAATTAAGQENDLANQTEDAAKTAATGDFVSSAFKGVAAIASIFL